MRLPQSPLLGGVPSLARRGGLDCLRPVKWITVWLLLLTWMVSGCASTTRLPDVNLVDAQADAQTQALYANLKRLAPEAVLFGHQDDLAYGVKWKREPGRSDVKDVAGSYPAVFGWELADLELGHADNIDGVNFEDMKRWIKEGYEIGGVITIAWHLNNPASGGNAWDTTRAVHTILPGGDHHLASGVYLYRLKTDAFLQTNRMVLMR